MPPNLCVLEPMHDLSQNLCTSQVLKVSSTFPALLSRKARRESLSRLIIDIFPLTQGTKMGNAMFVSAFSPVDGASTKSLIIDTPRATRHAEPLHIFQAADFLLYNTQVRNQPRSTGPMSPPLSLLAVHRAPRSLPACAPPPSRFRLEGKDDNVSAGPTAK